MCDTKSPGPWACFELLVSGSTTRTVINFWPSFMHMSFEAPASIATAVKGFGSWHARSLLHSPELFCCCFQGLSFIYSLFVAWFWAKTITNKYEVKLSSDLNNSKEERITMDKVTSSEKWKKKSLYFIVTNKEEWKYLFLFFFSYIASNRLHFQKGFFFFSWCGEALLSSWCVLLQSSTSKNKNKKNKKSILHLALLKERPDLNRRWQRGVLIQIWSRDDYTHQRALKLCTDAEGVHVIVMLCRSKLCWRPPWCRVTFFWQYQSFDGNATPCHQRHSRKFSTKA